MDEVENVSSWCAQGALAAGDVSKLVTISNKTTMQMFMELSRKNVTRYG